MHHFVPSATQFGKHIIGLLYMKYATVRLVKQGKIWC